MTIEGLSLLIGEERKCGRLWGIHITSFLVITHILFVGDVVLFGAGTMMVDLQGYYFLIMLCHCDAN